MMNFQGMIVIHSELRINSLGIHTFYRSLVRNRIRDRVRDCFRDRVRDLVCESFRDRIRNRVCNRVFDRVRNRISDRVRRDHGHDHTATVTEQRP